MAKLKNLAACASNRLQQASELPGNEARIEVRTLLQHSLGGVSHAWLIAHGDDPVTDELRARFENLLARRIHGEPIAHILGKREFFGREFLVTPATLIPRPDTEILVETALAKILPDQPYGILDMGTGTGAIGITLGLERPRSRVMLLDFSVAALNVARDNIQLLAAHNVRAILSDWFAAVQGQRFDLIVSNPPYIEAADPHLRQGDLRFEPVTALASGEDGLDDIRRIAAQAALHLAPSGWLMFEHGYNQGSAVRSILQRHAFKNIYTQQDLAGHDRVTLGQHT
ncbi:peptide chain release factor N(5)-glutamine methyltransferase [Methylobacillus arboreus]|uniref:peptide chain release factor N(5)-glutamine methyltransferase n=1 Tax=Methylobacillus arboreus TaxID=755170 RepID=UPI001E4B63C6|nr:peptide chain release factor N(5)-glutamine methyltransferase [Methylobacillus arboreus]MCB5190691.1 peptide chain release factor N(5)-glutamine methyltransferase [Methylobacillus arboreus]